MRSSGIHYTPVGEVTDNKEQHIRLQSVKVANVNDNVLMVDSDAKALKEESMHKKAMMPLNPILITNTRTSVIAIGKTLSFGVSDLKTLLSAALV